VSVSASSVVSRFLFIRTFKKTVAKMNENSALYFEENIRQVCNLVAFYDAKILKCVWFEVYFKLFFFFIY